MVHRCSAQDGLECVRRAQQAFCQQVGHEAVQRSGQRRVSGFHPSECVSGEWIGLAGSVSDHGCGVWGIKVETQLPKHRLVDELVARGASLVVFDVHFSREESLENEQQFRADELRKFMRALRAVCVGAPELLGAVESTSPSDPPVLLEQALKGFYAGEVNRFLNCSGHPGTIKTVLYHAVNKGQIRTSPRMPSILPARSCSSGNRTAVTRGSQIVSTPSSRVWTALTSVGWRLPRQVLPVC